MDVFLNDVTLRDGNHAVSHSIDLKFIEKYCKIADKSNLDSVEVGHGNGLGASSLQVGLSKESDENMLITARKNLKNTKLCVHSIPSFATIKKDLDRAINLKEQLDQRYAVHLWLYNIRLQQRKRYLGLKERAFVLGKFVRYWRVQTMRSLAAM